MTQSLASETGARAESKTGANGSGKNRLGPRGLNIIAAQAKGEQENGSAFNQNKQPEKKRDVKRAPEKTPAQKPEAAVEMQTPPTAERPSKDGGKQDGTSEPPIEMPTPPNRVEPASEPPHELQDHQYRPEEKNPQKQQGEKDGGNKGTKPQVPESDKKPPEKPAKPEPPAEKPTPQEKTGPDTNSGTPEEKPVPEAPSKTPETPQEVVDLLLKLGIDVRLFCQAGSGLTINIIGSNFTHIEDGGVRISGSGSHDVQIGVNNANVPINSPHSENNINSKNKTYNGNNPAAHFPAPQPTPEPAPAPEPVVVTPEPPPQNPEPVVITPEPPPQNPEPVVVTPEPGDDDEPEAELEPAPTDQEPTTDRPAPTPEPTPPPVEDETKFNLGAVALQDALSQNVLRNAQYVKTFDTSLKTRDGWYKFRDKVLGLGGHAYKIPILGGVWRSLLHPVEMVWQNNIASGVFDQQRMRFAADVEGIIKKGTDSTIHHEVTQEEMNAILEEGHKRRGKWYNPVRWYRSYSDTMKGILGVGQTSDMVLGKKWLQEQVERMNLAGDRNEALNRDLLSEQNEVGRRFSRLPSNMTLAEANRLILARGGLETRHQASGEIQRAANERLKALIAEYANSTDGTKNEEWLVKEVNKYLMTDFRNSLSPDEQKEFKAPEMASNIISIAHAVTGREMAQDGKIIIKDAGKWARYQQQDENGHSRWQDVNITVLYGKGDIDVERGKIHLNPVADRLARRMAERKSDIWSGTTGNSVMSGAAGLASDILVSGGYFAAGFGLSAGVAGGNMALRMAAGLAGIGAGTAVRETGVGFGYVGARLGIEGIKGRYAREVEQRSRERAVGIHGPKDAMSELMVPAEHANTISGQLEGLLRKPVEQMTESEARQLLASMAYADARMRLTDLSGSRYVNFRVNNYIEYTQGKKSTEEGRLKGDIMDGMVKLMEYQNTHPNFFPGQTLFSATSLEYWKSGQNVGVFEQYSAVMEAQLRDSSDVIKVKKTLMNTYGYTEDEATNMVRTIMGAEGVNKNISANDSLKHKENLLRWQSLKSGVKKAGEAVLTGVVAQPVYSTAGAAAGAVVGEGVALGQHMVQQGGIVEGIADYGRAWGATLNGDVPIAVSAGHIVSDASPFQAAVLQMRNVDLLHWPPFPPGHVENITDPAGHTVSLHLSPEISFQDHGGHQYFVDLRTGNVVDITGHHFTVQPDAAHPGHQQLMVVDDATGKAVPAETFPLFQNRIDVADGAVQHASSVNEILKPAVGPAGPEHWVDNSGVGVLHASQLPKGTLPDGTSWQAEWHYDAPTHSFNLVPVKLDGHHTPVVLPGGHAGLIEHAQFNADGTIHSLGYKDASIDIKTIPGSAATVTGAGAEHAWLTHEQTIGHQIYEHNGTPGVSDNNELQLYNSVYKNANGEYVIVMDGSHIDKASTGLWTQVPPHDVQPAVDGSPYGMQYVFRIPGHAGEIRVDAQSFGHGVKVLRLDPSDNTTQLLCDGKPLGMTAGELARMVSNQTELQHVLAGHSVSTDMNNPTSLQTELNHYESALNLNNGHMVVGYKDSAGSYHDLAQITGTGSLQAEQGGDPVIVVDMTDKIQETIDNTTQEFNLSGHPLPNGDWFMPFVPGRENMPRGHKATSAENERQPQSSATQTSVAHAPTPAAPTAPAQATVTTQSTPTQAANVTPPIQTPAPTARPASPPPPPVQTQAAHSGVALNRSVTTRLSPGAEQKTLLLEMANETMQVNGSEVPISPQFKKWMTENNISADQISLLPDIRNMRVVKLPDGTITIQGKAPNSPMYRVNVDMLRDATRGRFGDFNRWSVIEEDGQTHEHFKTIYLPIQVATGDGQILLLKLDQDAYGALKDFTLTEKEVADKQKSRIDGAPVNKKEDTEYAYKNVVIGGKNYEASVATDIGGERKVDEDYSLITEGQIGGVRSNLYAVFDGVGGGAAGDVASQEAAAAFKKILRYELNDAPLLQRLGIDMNRLNQQDIENLFHHIEKRVVEEMRKNPKFTDPNFDGGTTVAGVLQIGDRLFKFHCGDSRVYKDTPAGMQLMTSDHSLVQSLMSQNMLTPEQAKNHPNNNVVFRVLPNNDVLNATPSYKIDVSEMQLGPGEGILITCDGVPEAYDDEYSVDPTILHNAFRTAANGKRPARDMVKGAFNGNGALEKGKRTKDNMSVIMIVPK